MIPLNYHHLYYFYVVAQAGSISQACKTLLLAPPTVSSQLQGLEKALGRPLFERRKKSLILTEDGRIVFDYARAIFDIGRELKDTLRDRPLGGPRSVQIGFLNGTYWTITLAVIRCILEGLPPAQVITKEAPLEELINDLREQRLDVIVTDASVWTREGDLANHLVGKIPIVFATSPKVAKRYKQLPRDFDNAPFIMRSVSGETHQKILDFFAARKIRPEVVAEVQDIELARRLALAGAGIAVLNLSTVKISESDGQLAVLGQRLLSGLHESLYLVTQKRKWPNPLARYLIENLRLPR